MANQLGAERLNRIIDECRIKCDALNDTKRANLNTTSAIDFQEHFEFQKLQAEFHAGEMLTPDAAQIVYNALGASYGTTNGGWSKNTDLPTKIIVTQLMGELLKMKLAQRGVKV
jgi:hypothetical protein